MSDYSVTLMRQFVAYFEGVGDSLHPSKGVPTKSQWSRISDRVAIMRKALEELPASNGSNGYHAPPQVQVQVQSNPEVDVNVAGTTVERKWRAAVRAALEGDPYGMDPESASEAVHPVRCAFEPNTDVAAMAARIAGPN